MNERLPRIGPVLDLRELNERELHVIKKACAKVAADPEESRTMRIYYAAQERAIADEIAYRVLAADQPMNIPDGLD